MSDLISKADAIEAVHKYFVGLFDDVPHEIDEDGYDVFTDMKTINALLKHNKEVSKAIKALPPVVSTFNEDCIGRQDAIEALDRIGSLDTEADREYAKGIFDNIPPATPTERTGEWVTEKGSYEIICSKCGCEAFSKYGEWFKSDYCPNCGAKMRGGEDE